MSSIIINTRLLRMTARQERALQVLISPGGWIARDSIERISGASNGTGLIYKLRQRLGHDAIEMKMFDTADRNGKRSKHGRYRLTPAGRQRLAEQGLA